MFKIEQTDSQYKNYLLCDETTSSQVTVVPEKGGIVTLWRWQNLDIFYLDHERFTNPELSVRGGIPLLFPICGNLVDDSYEYEGKTYKLQQHGFARNLPWQVKETSTDQKASITLTLKSSEETRQAYPFDFELDFTYILTGNKLELIYAHRNLSDKPMPFSTGIHPYFCVPDKKKLKLDIPATQYQSKNDTNIQSFTGELDFDQEEIDIAFLDIAKNTSTVTDLERNLKLTIEYDDNYLTLVFWTVKGKDFYCLEPWSSPRNALNTGKNLLIAQPGATIETKISMVVESISI